MRLPGYLLSIAVLSLLLACPQQVPEGSGGPDENATSEAADPEPRRQLALYRIEIAGSDGELGSVTREASFPETSLFAGLPGSPGWLIGDGRPETLVVANETDAGVSVETAELQGTEQLPDGRRSYELFGAPGDGLTLLSSPAEAGSSGPVLYPLQTEPDSSGEAAGEAEESDTAEGALQLGGAREFDSSERVVPAGDGRFLALEAPDTDWGKFRIAVDPETREVWGEDERETILQSYTAHSFAGDETGWSEPEPGELTVVEPREKPPEFVVSPFFADGGMLIQLRADPAASPVDPSYRLLFHHLDSGRTGRAGTLPVSTRLSWAVRAGTGGRYVLAVSPPSRTPSGAPDDEDSEERTELMLYDSVTGGLQWRESLPAADSRLGLSRVLRGSGWMLAGTWITEPEEDGRSYGKFYYIDTSGRSPRVRLINLNAQDLPLLPPSNLHLEELFNGYRVQERDPANQHTGDEFVHLTEPSADPPRVVRLALPRFEPAGEAEFDKSGVRGLAVSGGVVYALVREEIDP